MTTDSSPRSPRPAGRRIRLAAPSAETVNTQHFSILVMCTAHHCRSPVMDAIWSARVQDRFGSRWQVGSAGTDPRVGLPPHPLAVTALAAAGFASTVVRAARVDADLVRGADLVLTAERRHRAEVARLVPSAVTRTFTLREFARLAGSVELITDRNPVTAGRELVRRAREARADHAPATAAEDDLIDPMGGGPEDFEACVRTVRAAVERILSAVEDSRPQHL